MPTVSAKDLNRLTSAVIASAIKIHSVLGPGLLENVYDTCLCHELHKSGLTVDRQKPLPLVYDGLTINCAYRTDIVVQDLVLLEVKALELVLPIHRRQMLTYLRLGNYRVGLLLNFGARTMREGIYRVVNRFPD